MPNEREEAVRRLAEVEKKLLHALAVLPGIVREVGEIKAALRAPSEENDDDEK